MSRIFLAWGPAVVWAAVLFYFSARSWPGGPPLPVHDKVAHLLVYAALGATLGFGRLRSRSAPPHWTLLAAGLVYAISDEFHQTLVPGRTASGADFVADAAGLMAGYWGCLALARRRIPGR